MQRTTQILFSLCFILSFASCRTGGGGGGGGGGSGLGGGGRGGGARGESAGGGRRGSHGVRPESGSAGQRSGNPQFRSFNDPGASGANGRVQGNFPVGQAQNNDKKTHGKNADGRPYGPLLPDSLRTPRQDIDRGPGVVVGQVNPNPPSTVPLQGGVTPETWKTLVAEHNKLHSKPLHTPAHASATPQGDPPSQLAQKAVKVCIECHGTTSNRHLLLDSDPVKALAGMKELMKGPNGVSWMKVTEMIRSTRFANLPADQEKALIAYLSGQSPASSTDEIYAQVTKDLFQGVTRPPETLPGSEKPQYRQMLNSIDTENPVLNAILRDPALVIYDDGFEKKYQDGGGGGHDVIGDHHEKGSILQSWRLPDGSPLFPGGHLYGPLGNGFGLSGPGNNFKFVWRPREKRRIVDDHLRVDAYKDSNSTGPPGQLMDSQHPVGTIFGEVVFEDGVVKDIRLREIAPGLRTFSTAYRQFTESSEMEKAVTELTSQHPEWKDKLRPLADHLASDHTLTPGPALKDQYYSPVIDVAGYQDILPQIPTEQQRALVSGKKFSSALQKEWKREGDKVAYAPTASGPSLLAARSIRHHGLEVSSVSCMRCHEFTETNFAFFAPNVFNRTTKSSNINNYGMLYGGARNNIFSYHSRPFDDPSDFGSNGFSTGSFGTSLGIEELFDNRRNPDGTWRIRPGAPIVSEVPPEMEKYYK